MEFGPILQISPRRFKLKVSDLDVILPVILMGFRVILT
jgi:hypothetical protein